MKSRNTLILGIALFLIFALLWLWKPRSESAARETLTPAEAAPAKSAAPAQQHAQTFRDDPPEHAASVDRLLPPEQRDSTLRAVVGPMLNCITRAGLSSAKMDPRMHARMHVGRGTTGEARLTKIDLIGGEDAPPEFRACVERDLLDVALALPLGTEGLVFTPPLAGREAEAPTAQGP